MTKDSEKSPEELYAEREKRIQDAIVLRVPNRVPVTPTFGFFASKRHGMTYKEAVYEPAKVAAAWEATAKEFSPDAYENPFWTRMVGPLAEIVNYKMFKWPGHGVSDNTSFQYLDFENLKADEYDEFLFDPTKFMLTKFWPRVFGNLEAFKNLPTLRMIQMSSGFASFAGLDTPEMDLALATIDKLRKQAAIINTVSSTYNARMEGLGFPPQFGPTAFVPFDLLSDHFRGTRGAMLDMYRESDKLLEALDKLLSMILEQTITVGKNMPCKRVIIPLHKGQEFFMSREQYARFYWPGFRTLMVRLIDAGFYPCPFVEGDYTSRLEFLADVPKGKVCYRFENVDMVRAKEILGGIACIQGGLPIALMCTGTPDDVKAQLKKMIDVVGKGGGYIVDSGVVLDDAREDNVRAMIEFTKEYGVYR